MATMTSFHAAKCCAAT